MTTKEIDDNSTASSDGEEAGLPVAVAVAIPDSDEEAQAVAAATREEATTNIREHCERHLSLNPESSYVGWIATLHPENAHVTIDSRFVIPGNPWLTIWEEAKDELHKLGGGRAYDDVLVTPTAPPDPDAAFATDVVDGQDDGSQQHHARKCEGSCLDFIIGNTLVFLSVVASFAFELAASYCYISFWICRKIVKMCSPPNICTLFPFFIAYLIGAIFQLIDMLLLFVGVIFVESVAAANYIIVTILACSHRRGKKMHQLTRKLPHMTRWAFRQSYFKNWDPPRTTFFVCGRSESVSDGAQNESE
mmetsp:Transcript_4967/g.7229  ORF Transcript_4967/g.7229 Transcript_4967/m.7229 type:complete len:305 (-) Transcript_4967:1157-2071(-)|eukprot:CAMPEP_0201685692 /NCGR_PEP_ID=MMETSP0578-20130828/375_1 /ASSEMBLY_ACC=CAM_ASM_000663 /TAXON_ID=267565 /ORGANISM="Skeletonema grethea, Strain CCMP 1804" /LENGTH=304 /DNA_ID=CAMNT_0048169635 /DNA_START=43 /DNA_END=957 /DNA_ORIENTATION=+